MNQSDFLKRLAEVKAEAVEISRRKNADYASDKNPFENFEACEVFGLSAKDGFIFRMADKLMRASHLIKRDGLVLDESLIDTLRDLSNYADIFSIYLEQYENRKTVDKSRGT